MRIEEALPNEFVKVKRKTETKTAKRLLIAFCGVLMCTGSYYYGNQTNQIAVKNFEKKLQTLQSAFEELHRARRNAEDEYSEHHVEKRQTNVITTPKSTSGAAYIRWGRRDCPTDSVETVLVYEGIAANTHYTYTGGGSNVLCADLNVTYTAGRYRNGNQGSSYLFGVEYFDSSSTFLRMFDMSDIEDTTFYRYDIPCAACFAQARHTQLMIPGQENCPSGWTKEYAGYILGAAHGNKHTTDYICVDEKPQIVHGSDGDQTGSRMYMTEAQCPSLQCGPYVAGREIRCVVCTI